MVKRTTRRLVLATILITLVGFFLPPFVKLNRFRNSIGQSMEEALGRRVTVGAITLRLLPRPGFDLQNLVVQDDPAFGAEPILRADAVTAKFRLSSLWHGRLEIASLSLNSGADINPPSLNLVLAGGGRWNVAALLQQAAQTPSAPTAQPSAGTRPRFPYIEVNGGRINFKTGQEKKAYALTEAKFALWQASEDEWAFRLAARPMRTDFSTIDTGVVKINGRFRRAPRVADTPLDLRVSLQDAQLGGLTKLIYGRDRGWRGTVQADVQLTGTPAALRVNAQTAISDFRRYDINAVDPLRLQVQCTARYSSTSAQLSAVDCQMPLGNGLVLFRGDVEGPLQPRTYNLNVAARTVNLQTLVILARHIKKDLPNDLSAVGDLDLAFNVRKGGANVAGLWSGGGRSSEITLSSSVLKPRISLPALGFAVEAPGSWASRRHKHKTPGSGISGAAPQSAALHLMFAPFRVPLGGAGPVNVSASFGGEDYNLHVQGDARIARLLQFGRALGLRVPSYQVDGPTHVDLHLAGTWAGFAAPQITGNAQLRNVTAPVRGLNTALQIASADLRLGYDAARLQHLALRFSGSPLQLSGWASWPRNCASLDQCLLDFDLQGDLISLDELNRLLNPQLAKRPWYDVFSSRETAPLLARIRASGHLRARRFALKTLTAQHVSAQVGLQAGVLVLNELRGDMLGGKHRGTWRADFNATQPEYSGQGTLLAIAAPQLATLMHDNWAAGTLDATYQVKASGVSAREVVSSLGGTAKFEWRNGALRQMNLSSHSGPLQFRTFTGQLEMHNRVLSFNQAQMVTAEGPYEVSGTVALTRQLALKIRGNKQAYNVLGLLGKPSVTPLAGTENEVQAALKPNPPKPPTAKAP